MLHKINDFISLHRWARMPWLFLVRRNCLCVELDVTGWEVSLREFVYFVIDPVNFAFKYGNTPKDEVTCPRRRPGFLTHRHRAGAFGSLANNKIIARRDKPTSREERSPT
jgi:hypothetical protein